MVLRAKVGAKFLLHLALQPGAKIVLAPDFARQSLRVCGALVTQGARQSIAAHRGGGRAVHEAGAHLCSRNFFVNQSLFKARLQKAVRGPAGIGIDEVRDAPVTRFGWGKAKGGPAQGIAGDIIERVGGGGIACGKIALAIGLKGLPNGERVGALQQSDADGLLKLRVCAGAGPAQCGLVWR